MVGEAQAGDGKQNPRSATSSGGNFAGLLAHVGIDSLAKIREAQAHGRSNGVICQCFVQNLSQIPTPPTYPTKKHTPSQQDNDSSTRSRNKKPVLGRFDQDAETEKHTNASNPELGAVFVLMEEGTECIVAYASCTLAQVK